MAGRILQLWAVYFWGKLTADAEFESYDFGEVGFQGCSGWEYVDGSSEMRRPCYITDEDAGGDASLKVTFVVRFKPGTAEVSEVYAIHKGNVIGKRSAANGPHARRFSVIYTITRIDNTVWNYRAAHTAEQHRDYAARCAQVLQAGETLSFTFLEDVAPESL